MLFPSHTSIWRRLPLAAAYTGLLLGACSLPVAIPAQSVDEVIPRLPDLPAVPARLRFPVLDIRRDPFAPLSEGVTAAALPFSGGADIVLPPNAGAFVQNASGPGTAGFALRAVVLGGDSKALIEVGGHSMLVGIGSRLLGSVVTGIHEDGVTLQDGERLRLSERPR